MLVVPWYVLRLAFDGDVRREVDVDVDVLREEEVEFTRLGTSGIESLRGLSVICDAGRMCCSVKGK